MKTATKIMLLCPLGNKGVANGGITSWSQDFVRSFPDEEFELFPVDTSPKKHFSGLKKWERYYYGMGAFFRILRDMQRIFRAHPDLKVMHITTSASYGVFRDNIVCRVCQRRGIKTVMHCRFGSIRGQYLSTDRRGRFFRKNLQRYDQIWVLDSLSAQFLKEQEGIGHKIFTTPNPIRVPATCSLVPKTYRKVGYIGNLLPTKGVRELVEAVVNSHTDTELLIVGPGDEDYIGRLKDMAAPLLDTRIKFMGRVPNDEAVGLIDSLDILALPTYYWGEAFPISILEAMSRGKLVISCRRAAIPDMLTSVDGSPCGILVQEKSSQALADAITWCQDHRKEADEMCRKAYEKVKDAYRKEVVYDIYRQNYRRLLSSDHE